MTHAQAVKVYLNAFVHSSAQIKRIMLWDANKTLAENARVMKTQYGNVQQVSRRFKLKYRPDV